jgi:hypothetical protein
MSPQAIEQHLIAAQLMLMDNIALIAAIGLSAWLATTLLLPLVRHRDTKVSFLADFFGVESARIVPLPPATALWSDYCQIDAHAEADTQFPQGAPTLQGSYLIHAEGGMTLVAVHNFDLHTLYEGAEEPDLVDYIESSFATHGRLEPHRLPVEIEEDAARRAHIVESLLKAKFGYPGKVRAITLLRDKDQKAPEPDLLFTRSDEALERLTFDQQDKARRAIFFDENPVEARKLPQIKRWFMSYPGRQTPRFRFMLRSAVLALTVGILLAGQSAVEPQAIASVLATIGN